MNFGFFFQGLLLGAGIYLVLNGFNHIRQGSQRNENDEVKQGFNKTLIGSMFFIAMLIFTVAFILDFFRFITIPLVFILLFQFALIAHFVFRINK